MSSTQPASDANAALRDKIISDPALILEDPRILDALVAAQDEVRGGNIVDMRGLAMSRLEDRLDRLEGTHQTVLAAAYDNVATTRQVHRALLTMIAPLDFDAFLAGLATDTVDALRLRSVRLILESETPEQESTLAAGPAVVLVPPGFIMGWLGDARRSGRRAVVLRPVNHGLAKIYGEDASDIRSEALMRIDLGPDRLPALLALGAETSDHFVPGQATDLLELFGRVCERLLRSWLG